MNVAGVTLEEDVVLEANGVRLYSDVYRPARRGSFPVLLIRLPYDKRQAQNVTFSHPSWYAATAT